MNNFLGLLIFSEINFSCAKSPGPRPSSGQVLGRARFKGGPNLRTGHFYELRSVLGLMGTIVLAENVLERSKRAIIRHV